MPTITLLPIPEYQARGAIHLHVLIIQSVWVAVRLHAIPDLLFEILIGAHLSNKVCRIAHNLDPRWILILLLRSQWRDRAAVRVVTLQFNIEFVKYVENCIENFISIPSLHASLFSSTML